jgi:hypothetical protein
MFVAVGMFLIESSVNWLWCFVWLWITGYWWLGGWLDGDLHTHCAQCQRLSVCKCERAACLHVLVLWTLSVDNFEVAWNGVCLCLECGLDETESTKLWFVYMWWGCAHMHFSVVVAMCTSITCVVEQAMNGVEIGIVIVVRPTCCANVCRSGHVSNRIECWLVVVFWVIVDHWILMACWLAGWWFAYALCSMSTIISE